MKCPNCGAEIPADSIYCLQCGEDIHIVPDFEPEIEFNLEEALSTIAEEFGAEQSDEAAKQREDWMEDEFSRINKRHSRRILLLLGIFGVLLLVAGGAVGWMYYRYNSLDYQVERARECVEQEQYERAAEYYRRALELDSDNIDIKFALSDVYFRKNNKIEYEFLLRDIANDKNAGLEQLESAYGKLIAIYRAREDYRTIDELLSNCENEDIRNKYQNYVAEPPEFSVSEGYYSTLQPLKLSALAAGTIYYTMDGSEPTEESHTYTAPILLDEGDYQIKAYFVNEYGIASEIVTQNYHIVIEELPIPEVGTGSGEYSSPIDIEILEDDENIYYTTDGSTPTMTSRVYAAPIPMPLGRTVFRFIRIAEDGRSSPVVERIYNLKLKTEYSIQDVEWVVIEYAFKSGKIYDYEGHFYGSNDSAEMYKYQYQYVKHIEGADDYFIIAEVYSDADGVCTKTGNYYAVNAYDKQLYRVQISGSNYTLVEIEG
ncbi:MAG: chitobiase/beta-hexosaminidase C-terminal domain-containing protein [Lachnospiraceae bacterium]|nr:chitobiase/beta-hexosaminidase C-terminal domain-containing protein [Lachnospiraceae bacterium]